MAKLISLTDVPSCSDRSFIFDTNVWLYLLSDYSTKDFGYSEVYESVLSNDIEILLPPIVATEFVNRYCRQAFEVFKNQGNNSKASYKHDFRPTMAYKIAYSYITQLVDVQLFSFTKQIGIEEADLSKSIKNPVLADLNDDIILNIACRTNSVIVSHDRDFRNAPSRLLLLQL